MVFFRFFLLIIFTGISSVYSKSHSYPETVMFASRVLVAPFFAIYSHWSDNFHEVDPGHLYRSAQLSPKKLAYYCTKYGIKSIINLRGVHPDQKWWRRENKFCLSHGIDLYNIPMHHTNLSQKEDIKKLLQLYVSAKKPILIHCRQGVDRTGEAAALWRLEQEKSSKKEALEQLTLRYGHFACLHPAKRFLIEIWQGVDWLENEYPSHLIR